MRKLSRREKILVFLIVIILIGWILDFLVINPLCTKSKLLLKEIHQKESLLKKYLKIKSQKEYLEKEYEKIKKYLTINTKNPEALASRIESGAKRVGISILDLRTQEEIIKRKGVKSYIIKIQGEGKADRIVNFIYQVEKCPDCILKIKSLALTPKDERGILIKMNIEIRGVVIL